MALIFLDEACPPERMADIGAFMAYLLLAAAGSWFGLMSDRSGQIV